ncbi:MAG: hypothetical protein AAF355_03415 [Myxococcota bacterium]
MKQDPSDRHTWARQVGGSRYTPWLLVVAAAICAVGCRSEPSEAEVQELPVVIEPQETAAVEPARPTYDDEGALLGGSDVIAGLRMPRGLRLEAEERRKHRYRTEVPIAKVLQYFGPRLFTGQVEKIGAQGAAYRYAVPRGVRGGQVKLDVVVRAMPDGGAQIEVVERVPPSKDPPSANELRRLYLQKQRYEQ